jgi:hypothetical protein
MTEVLEWDLRNQQLGKEKAKAKHREHREEESGQLRVKGQKSKEKNRSLASPALLAAGKLREAGSG